MNAPKIATRTKLIKLVKHKDSMSEPLKQSMYFDFIRDDFEIYIFPSLHVSNSYYLPHFDYFRDSTCETHL